MSAETGASATTFERKPSEGIRRNQKESEGMRGIRRNQKDQRSTLERK
jgi:hypothetical protein